jgi:glutamate formiminotransferase
VRALGLPLPSRDATQVSTNLTRPDVTPIAAVFEAVGRLAAAEGVPVVGSEIVGLTPSAALPPDPRRALRLERPPKILEDEIDQAFGPS